MKIAECKVKSRGTGERSGVSFQRGTGNRRERGGRGDVNCKLEILNCRVKNGGVGSRGIQ